MADDVSDPISLLDGAFDALGAKVHAVPADRWGAATPCTEWSVRDLVNHLVAEHLWVPHLLRGETIDEVGNRYDGDVLGDEPVGAWDRASDASRRAWQQLPTPETVVHLSFGDFPAREYAEQMLLDLVVHGWDLARGAGLDAALEPLRAAHVLGYLEPHAKEWHDVGVLGDPVEVESAEPGPKLLGLAGRRP